LERGADAHRRRDGDARSLYGRLQAEEAELPLPRPLHGALERHLDHAQARVREGRGPPEVRLQQAGLARRLRAAQLRSRRPVVHPEFYHGPLQEWLGAFELDTGKQKIRPYDATVGRQIADMLRPSMGDQIPTDAQTIASSFGMGWWKTNPEAASELLEKAGFK